MFPPPSFSFSAQCILIVLVQSRDRRIYYFFTPETILPVRFFIAPLSNHFSKIVLFNINHPIFLGLYLFAGLPKCTDFAVLNTHLEKPSKQQNLFKARKNSLTVDPPTLVLLFLKTLSKRLWSWNFLKNSNLQEPPSLSELVLSLFQSSLFLPLPI